MSAKERDNSKDITRENLDRYLYELAREYKKLAGRNTPAELILIGGAVVVSQYHFRESTTDIDAVIQAASAMKEAIMHVEERLGLPHGWINSDFQKTTSYSRNLVRCSSYYRSFCQVLSVRMVKAEYLIAMKLRAYRYYKHDISDIVGVLTAHYESGNPITMERVDHAMTELYGSWDGVSPEAVKFIEDRVRLGDYLEMYDEIQKNEKKMRDDLMEIEASYPGVLSNGNIKLVMESLLKKRKEEKNNNSKDQSDRRDDE